MTRPWDTGRVAQRPTALAWYKVYCYLFALLNFASAWKGFSLVRDPHGVINKYAFLREQAIDQQTTDLVAMMVVTVGWTLVALGLVFGVTAFTLPLAPDNKKTWVAHLVHILFGATSCVLTPLCLPLLVAWLKPEVKEWFAQGG
jgi:hypothetical protein